MADNITKYNNSITAEEHRLKSQMGGIRSGQVRRQNRILRTELEKNLDNPEVISDICKAIINKARRGDVRAFEVIRDSIGESPKVQMDINKEEETMEIHVFVEETTVDYCGIEEAEEWIEPEC